MSVLFQYLIPSLAFCLWEILRCAFQFQSAGVPQPELLPDYVGEVETWWRVQLPEWLSRRWKWAERQILPRGPRPALFLPPDAKFLAFSLTFHPLGQILPHGPSDLLHDRQRTCLFLSALPLSDTHCCLRALHLVLSPFTNWFLKVFVTNRTLVAWCTEKTPKAGAQDTLQLFVLGISEFQFLHPSEWWLV